MVKVQEGSHEQKFVTIPKELAKAMGLEKGKEVEWSVEDQETLELKKNS